MTLKELLHVIVDKINLLADKVESGGSNTGGAFVVNFSTEDGENYTCDKTFNEVSERIGRENVIGVDTVVDEDGECKILYSVARALPNQITFICVLKQKEFIPNTLLLLLNSDNTVEFEYAEIK